MSAQGPESRAHPRYALEVDAEVRTASQMIPARSRDVSRGGMCFVTRTPITLGSDVHITMALVFDEETFSEPLAVRARVVWCTGLGAGRHQVGTTFFGLTAENRAYLDMFLRFLKEGQAAERAAQPGPSLPGRNDKDFGS